MAKKGSDVMRKSSWIAGVLAVCAFVLALPKVSKAKDDDMILRLTTRYEWDLENADTTYNMVVLSKTYPRNYLGSLYIVNAYDAEGAHMKSNTFGFSGMKIWPNVADISIGYNYTYSFNRAATVDNDDTSMSFSGNYILWTGRSKQSLTLTGSYNTLTDFDTGQIWYAGLQYRHPIDNKWTLRTRARYAYSEDVDEHVFNEYMANLNYKITKLARLEFEYRFYDMEKIGNVARDNNETFSVGINYTY